MSGPAEVAAQRAWDAQNISGMKKSWAELPEDNTFVRLQIASAREALKPIRELHKPTEMLCHYWQTAPTRKGCTECRSDWPCDTARLIYSPEELG